MATKTNMTIEELAKQIAEIAYSQGTDVYDAGKWLAKVLLRKNILIPTIMLRRASEQAETRLEFLEDVTMQESNSRNRAGVSSQQVGESDRMVRQEGRLAKNTIMLRQSGNHLGKHRVANMPVSFVKGTLFEHIRLVDGTHSWVKVNGNLYLAKNADVIHSTVTVRDESLLEARMPKPEDATDWGGEWDSDVPKNLRIWKGLNTGKEPKPNLPVLSKIPYFYHGASMTSIKKLLSSGVKATKELGSVGLNVTADISYAKSYARHAIEDDPNMVIGIVAIPTRLIDWNKATMSDSADDEANAQVYNAIPAGKLKLVAIGAHPKKLRSLKSDSLREQAEAPPRQMADFQAPPQKPVSLDQVVDRYIVRYERESIPLEGEPGPGPAAGAQTAGGSPSTLEEGANLKSLMSFLLMEQAPPAPPPEEEEDAPPPADDAPAPDAGAGLGDFGGGAAPEGDAGGLGGDDAGGGMDDAAGGPPPGAPPVVNTPQINLNDFARSVARMVNNFDALLNPKTIILNRVEAYIKSNYNDMTAKQFMQIMERNYGLNVTSVEYPEEDSDFPTPYAGSAVMGAGGGGG